MKERIAKAILGCCRLKRRIRTLIRNVRSIVTDPDSQIPPPPSATMSRRPCEQLEALGPPPNMVDEVLTGSGRGGLQGEGALTAMSTDDQCRGLALGERLRAHIDAIIGRAIGGKIDHR